MVDLTNEDRIYLGDEQQGAFITNSNINLDDKTEVVEISFEKGTDRSHLWLVSHNSQSKKNQIIDLKNTSQVTLWDKEAEA
jgi:hypothetical protein